MTVYLSIRSDSRHSRSIRVDLLVKELSEWPNFQRGNKSLFNIIRDGEPRAFLYAIACSAEGNFAVFDESPLPIEVNLIELQYPYSETQYADKYDLLTIDIACFLGWEAWTKDDDGKDVCLWSPTSHGS